MVFNSAEALQLHKRFHGRPSWEWPRAYQPATAEHLAGERALLERLYQSAPKRVRAAWLPGLMSRRDSQHIATWFEMMLFGWLLGVGSATPIPASSEQTPDFRAKVGGQSIYIEAVTHLIPEPARAHERRVSQLYHLIHQTPRPYVLQIHSATLVTLLKPHHFKDAVVSWLDAHPEEGLHYQDASGNSILMTASPGPVGTDHALFCSSGEASWIDHRPLMKPLRKKADKYRKLRHRSPFVIALLPESPMLSAHAVASALFGRTQVIIDRERLQVSGVQVDRTGILFHRDSILHTSVSGILVFGWRHSERLSRRFLDASYIENPFALHRVNPGVFPTKTSFTVIGRTSSAYQMAWGTREPD